MKKVLIGLIHIYQKVFSLDTGFLPRIFGFSRPVCMFYPRCSSYMAEAIEKHGIFQGVRLGVKRIGRCNPRSEPGVDLVPDKLPFKR